MDSYITWIIVHWATALVYYVLAGVATAVITSFYLSLRGTNTPYSTMFVAVVLPPVWLAIVTAHIIRAVLLWAIAKYRHPKRKRHPWERPL